MTGNSAFDVRLVGSRPLSPLVRELTFERVDGAPFHYRPGQWVNLVLPLPDGDEPFSKRAYSIASAPSESPRFEVAVTRVEGGAGSEFLHSLSEGEVLRAVGPHGLFTREPTDPAPALFIATGTGVTPLRAMLQAALRGGARVKFALLFGARHEEDVLYESEFAGCLSTGVLTHYEVTLSQPAVSWTGRRGYVQVHLPEVYRDFCRQVAPAEPHVYICGLDRMVSTVRELARSELGVGRKQVHIERYD